MKNLLVIVLAAVCLTGCSNSDDSVKQAAPLNPSGKPRNAREQRMSTELSAAGERLNAQMAAAAEKMKAAKARTGTQ